LENTSGTDDAMGVLVSCNKRGRPKEKMLEEISKKMKI
jgi:hypothetical protein